MSFGMGRLVSETVLHTCDSCESTNLCEPGQLRGMGWIAHHQGGKTFLMCDECERIYAERRKTRDQPHGNQP